jgi:mono/diheme cytochrome c family protein
MRRMHRNVRAVSVGAGLVLLLVVAAYFYLGKAPDSGHHGTQEKTLQPPATPATVDRGAYLARLGNCALCHTARGGDAYAGGVGVETPFGTVFSSNITPDKAQGIGAWSAQDFWGALHEGRSRDGHLLYPAFPYTSYTHVTREDSDAIYSYLQTLPASQASNVAHAVRWPFNTQAALAVWRGLGFTPSSQAAVPVVAQSADFLRARGAYLVMGLGHCAQCHSPRNFLGAI